MIPLDGGDTEIVRVFDEKDAVTEADELIRTEQVCAVPEQAPDHPENDEPALGTALRVTDVPFWKRVPVGLVVTAPCPLPVFLAVKEYWVISGVPPCVGTPPCVMGNACPPTVIRAVRDAVPGFTDRENLIVPLPDPLFGEAMVTQAALDDAVH